jgi:4'-phosphopantetheinyl transferase
MTAPEQQRDDAWFRLPPGEVHLWGIALDAPADMVQRLRSALSPDEIKRAERFVFEHHRRRFIVGRGALRSVLGRYLEIEPARVTFEYGHRGKPRLAPSCDAGISFNLAHSEERALLAIARGPELGVDLEWHKPLRERDGIANCFFQEQTRRDYFTIVDSERPSAFYRAWTRTEAVMKAVGEGLSLGVDVTVAMRDPPRVREIVNRPGVAERIRLLDLAVRAGFTAALAVDGDPPALRFFNGLWVEPQAQERDFLFTGPDSMSDQPTRNVIL